MQINFCKLLSITLLLFLQTQSTQLLANDKEVSFEEAFELGFNDSPVSREIEHPEWFKESFLDLRDDLAEATENGKQGIALYFGQANCAYCKALMEINFHKPDIVD